MLSDRAATPPAMLQSCSLKPNYSRKELYKKFHEMHMPDTYRHVEDTWSIESCLCYPKPQRCTKVLEGGTDSDTEEVVDGEAVHLIGAELDSKNCQRVFCGGLSVYRPMWLSVPVSPRIRVIVHDSFWSCHSLVCADKVIL